MFSRAYSSKSTIDNDGENGETDQYRGDYWEQQYSERLGRLTNSPLSSLFTSVTPQANSESHSSNNEPSMSAPTQSRELTHTDSSGKANMVDVSGKEASIRVAEATATVYLGETAYDLVRLNENAKGDVLAVARIAAIIGAKKTSDLIPLCHNIPISKVSVEFAMHDSSHTVKVYSEAKTVHVTGVEMEALTAATVAALTIYDMCKALSHDILISDIKLLHKSGGKSTYNV